MEGRNLSARLDFTPDGEIIAVYPFALNDKEEAETKDVLRWIIKPTVGLHIKALVRRNIGARVKRVLIFLYAHGWVPQSLVQFIVDRLELKHV